MLKFLGLSVVLGGIFWAFILSSTVQASTTGPVIYQLQNGASGAASQELISIYNNYPTDVDITDWCIIYSSSSDLTQTTLGCIGAPDANTKLWLTSNGYFSAASNEFIAVHPAFIPDITFVAGIADAGGHIKLVDANKAEVDRLGYGTATQPEGTVATKPAAGKILQRSGTILLQDTDNNALDFTQAVLTSLPSSGIYEITSIPDACPNLDGVQPEIPAGYLADAAGNCQLDICPNLDGLQTAIPSGYESLDGITCTLIPPLPPEDAALIISELLPNVAGSDTGKEFIEIYNPNVRAINLKDYKLELGPSFSKSYIFTEQIIKPGSFVSFSDSFTSIVLPNTTAWLRFIAPAGNIVNTSVPYDTPADDESWALIDNMWQYTNQLTPGSINLADLPEPGLGGGDDETILAVCPPGKFRNPETNRCKNIENSESSLTPCSADQVRNPETNRCRSVFATTNNLTPCQPGQTRNPETNRCRSATTAASASLKPCPANQERNPSTNRCRKKSSSIAAGNIKDVEAEQISGGQNNWMIVGGVVAAAAGYGAWEWRSEMMNGLRRFRQLFSKSPVD